MTIKAAILEMIERDHGFAAGNISSILTFNSQTITCIRGTDIQTHIIEDAGEYIANEFPIVCLYSDFEDEVFPSQRATVDVDGTNYHVVDVQTSPGDANVTITLRRDT